jgi:hypothetical protein
MSAIGNKSKREAERLHSADIRLSKSQAGKKAKLDVNSSLNVTLSANIRLIVKGYVAAMPTVNWLYEIPAKPRAN